ncbi:MAG TPA: leucyl aminopeptidase [Candidatus Dependentiae bacterium]|nr:leucyl aminopeptidase [Candidatus Dependentiae bacterium]HRQ62451.1 leucyl aminopeptidase [Candidatus Dependentiae bacterium]
MKGITMVTIDVSSKQLFEQKVACYIMLLAHDFGKKDVAILAKEYPDLHALLKKKNFTGKLLQTITVPVRIHNELVYVVLVGMGKQKDEYLEIENYRRALGKALRVAIDLKCETAAVAVPSANLFGADVQYLAQQTATIVQMAAYHFDEYISKNKEEDIDLFQVVLCVDAKHATQVKEGAKEGSYIGQAVNMARHWIDLPPSVLTPPQLADKAMAIAKEHHLDITVFDKKQLEKLGMGGIVGVSVGSDIEPRLVIMEYKTKKKDAPTLAFVGKGITFDSGGLSIKPAVSMETMKDDMSGAAAVIATMQALAQLKPEVNVVGVTPLAENLPSGKATKPGDILRFYNGKTAEVKNTDAEGRLILADALSYTAQHYKPDAMIDLATLTGACSQALGPFYTGMMSQHDELIDIVEDAAFHSGDHVWRLPLHDDYKVAIKSDVADLCNIGSGKYRAGAITAGHFLKNFVGDIPWVHLDIAGTAFDVPDRPYYRSGATGVGVRLLVDLAMNWPN